MDWLSIKIWILRAHSLVHSAEILTGSFQEILENCITFLQIMRAIYFGTLGWDFEKSNFLILTPSLPSDFLCWNPSHLNAESSLCWREKDSDFLFQPTHSINTLNSESCLVLWGSLCTPTCLAGRPRMQDPLIAPLRIVFTESSFNRLVAASFQDGQQVCLLLTMKVIDFLVQCCFAIKQSTEDTDMYLQLLSITPWTLGVGQAEGNDITMLMLMMLTVSCMFNKVLSLWTRSLLSLCWCPWSRNRLMY